MEADPLRAAQRPVPEAGPGELLLKVRACGYAEFMVAPQEFVYPLPDAFDDVTAGGCAPRACSFPDSGSPGF